MQTLKKWKQITLLQHRFIFSFFPVDRNSRPVVANYGFSSRFLSSLASCPIICSLLVKITKEASRDKFQMRFLKKRASKKRELTQVIKYSLKAI